MKKEEIQKYIDLGYKLPYQLHIEDLVQDENIKIGLIVLTAEDLRKIARGDFEQYERFFEDDKITMCKCDAQHHIIPDDLIAFLEKQIKKGQCCGIDVIDTWMDFLGKEFDGDRLFVPEFDGEYNSDILFDDCDHIVRYAIYLLYCETESEVFIEPHTLVSILEFIKDSTKNIGKEFRKREYSKEALQTLVPYLSRVIEQNKDISQEIKDFYIEKLNELSESNDYSAMWNIGYNYYEGINGYPVDFNKSLYYLEKCYEMKHDPEIARTIGYIYYYGRTTNGVPQGDKAFQYFAVAHFAGNSTEATYKLADCYVKGYGTPINYEAAFNIVYGMLAEEFNFFTDDCVSKLADVALRLGNYYKEGIGVGKNEILSYEYFLLARYAIKERLECMDYIGDRGLAASISKSIKEYENDPDCIFNGEREIMDGGYLLKRCNFFTDDLKVKDVRKISDNKVSVILKANKEIYGSAFKVETTIGYFEKGKKIEYIVASKEPLPEFDSKIRIKYIYETEPNVLTFLCKDNSRFEVIVDKLIFVPHKLHTLTKDFLIASVRYENSDKTYDYLCKKKNAKVGEKVLTNNGKTVEIVSLEKVYEDQLPLPIEKMGIVK